MLNTIVGMLSGGAAPTDYESIATTTVGSGGTGTITFSSIPSTYSHLQLRFFVRSNRSNSGFEFARVRFNSDTGSNYALHALYGDGSAATSEAEVSVTQTQANRFAGNVAPSISNTFGASVYDILDYANTNKYKTTRNRGGVDFNGAGQIGIWSGLWQNTAAISTITITPGGGSLFSEYSSFALYGIK